MWKRIKSTISRKRGCPDCDLELEQPVAKKARFFPTQHVSTAALRRAFPPSSDRKTLHKFRYEHDSTRRDEWIRDFVPPGTVCLCSLKNIRFCICHKLIGEPRTYSNLPAEILHTIFGLAIPHEDLLNPSLVYGPNSAWCHAMAMKSALVLVCRAWYLAGIDFLYRHVSFRRPLDLIYFCESLEETPRLAQLVRSINFMSYVPPAMHDDISDSVKVILQKCTALTSVNDLPPFLPPSRLAVAFPPTITSIKLSVFDHINHVRWLLREHCGHLEELTMPVDSPNGGAIDLALEDQELLFPRLHTLTLLLTSESAVPMSSLGAKWRMPRLRRLTLSLPYSTMLESAAFWWAAGPEDYCPFLTRHGRTLDYLAFNGYHRYDDEDVCELDPLIALCPAVTHLVVPHNYCASYGGAVHPSVKWLDVWFAGASDGVDDWPFMASRFPNLVGHRIIDPGLLPHIPDPGLVFDPRVADEWALEFPGLVIKQDQYADGVTRICFGDMPAADAWGLTYFGDMETNAVEREQEYEDHRTPGHIENWRQRDFYPEGFCYLVRERNKQPHPAPRWRFDADVMGRRMRLAMQGMWLADETDDEESDLESENLATLEDEFYVEEDGLLQPKPKPPVSHLDWTSWRSPRDSFPWLSSALRDSVFPTLS
ncbi:hypothetical protein B0H15DRAFT_170655 [Mycena belliarum]|uniref:F-box domain-containing protein n=1 Tax=Mycena belliarum TaxID=1033014 RepID=A0AAD6UBU2_9AGAR|nr:hypothetical protein B0H15DRAFT_170655 [Mycena belliae]